MKLTVVGCGDAFGSGGRLQTGFHVAAPGGAFMIDCGVTTLAGLSRCGLAANVVGTILITHLHGDHFGGLVWWLLHAQHVAKRTAPLTVAGPPGIEARFTAACEALFPDSSTQPRRFELRFQELRAGAAAAVDDIRVTAFEVRHPSGAPSHALRIEAGGRTIAYSGDTEWVEALVPCAAGADLYITECSGYDRAAPFHLSWSVLAVQLRRLAAQRIMLTHMGDDMLAHAAEACAAGLTVAEDGLVLDV